MANLIGKIYEANIADKSEEYYRLFTSNRNVFRHLPAMDGLKPVQRRCLYSLYADYKHDLLYKVGSISGTVMGKYHPHGNSSIEQAMGSMANPYFNNLPLIEGHGNFGSADGDAPGHPRYIEAKLSAFGNWCYFTDFDTKLVDMTTTYTGRDKEPEFLPSRCPAILINGAFSSIGGGGLSSNIPPYNFKEVCEATLKLLKNPKAKIYFVPDSPTGCDVFDDAKCRDGFFKGVGSVTFQSTYDVDYYNSTVTITSVPPMIKMKECYNKICQMKSEGKLPELKDHSNNTNKKNGISYTMVFKPDTNLDEVMERILKSNIGFRVSKPIGITLIDDYCDKDFTIPSLLLAWIDSRREYVRSMFNTELVINLEDKHMNDVKLFVFGKDNLNKTLKIAKSSANRQEYMKRLMEEYGITSLQADVISQMRTSDFNKDSYERFVKLDIELREKIAKLEHDIDDPESIDRTIAEQLQEGIKLFGSARKSKIIDPDNIGKNEEHLIGISEDGYVKKVTGETTIGKISKNPGMKNYINLVTSRDKLMLFNSNGVITSISVSDIPDSKVTSHGIPMSRFLPSKTMASSKIVGALKVPSRNDPDIDKYQLIMVTSKGNVKKILVSAFLKMKTDMLAITTDDDNELVAILSSKVDSDRDIILYTNFGDGVRISLDSIRTYTRSAKGASQVSLRANEEIVGANKIDPTKEYLVYITSSGKAKLTKQEYFPVMKKKDKPLPLINLGSTEKLVGIGSVNEENDVKVYLKMSEPVIVDVKSIKVTTRVAKAEKIVKTPKGDAVVGFEVQ